jgi:hypothetical protein
MKMTKKTKSRSFLIVVSITMFLIVCYALWAALPGQEDRRLPEAARQDRPVGKDPFQEALEKQQQPGAAASISEPKIQPVQIVHGHTTVTVQAGTDPFKRFLELQSQSRPEDAVISPFGQ